MKMMRLWRSKGVVGEITRMSTSNPLPLGKISPFGSYKNRES